jgi:hypothetical protein
MLNRKMQHRLDGAALAAYIQREGQRFNMDAAESMFFARQLEEVRARTFDTKLVELKARMLIPVDNSVNPGADVVTYRQFTGSGVAKIIASYADDLPRADAFGKEFHVPIKSIGASYGYNIQEIRAAQMVGLPLEQRRANNARRAVEERIDSIAQSGDADSGLVGLFNQSAALLQSVPNGAAGSSPWANKTPAEIIQDMNSAVNNVINTTHEVEHPDTMLLPVAQYSDISSRPWNPNNSSNVTVLEFFLKNSPWISEVEPWYGLAGAGSGGVDRGLVYKRDPDHLMLVISQEFEQFPPQPKNLEFVVPCHARCGGVQAPYPLAINYFDGI